MTVIGFFGNLFSQFSSIVTFVTRPLGEQFEQITVEPLASASILQLFGISLVGLLGTLLVIHVIRLFIGG